MEVPMTDAPPDVPIAPTDRLVGQSPVLHALRTQIQHLTTFDGVGKAEVPTLLLQGETGTGKGLVARVSHDSGPRAHGPFIEVNCAAIPETLLEAELFGFEAGAFSDAKRAKLGLFEAASGGTLFLDEIDALPLVLQGKLLTALEGKRVRRLGAVAEQPVDVKLMAATQVELNEQVKAGRFRADLYHWLAVVVLAIPPLRTRGEDILVLAEHFLRRYATVHGLDPKRLSGAAKAWLRRYSWPGNVRELGHLLERVTRLSPETIVGPETLARLCLPPTVAAMPAAAAPIPGADVLQDEAARIRQVLEQTRGNVVQAARRLGLKRSTLCYRMVRAGLASPRGGAALALRTARRGAMLPPQESNRGGALGGEAFEPSPGWEQKPVAVLAIDLSFPIAMGLEALSYEPRTVARRWEQAIAEKVQGFSGVLLQRTASPLMVAFGLPQALDQLPQRAVQTALAIRQLVTEAQAAAGQEPVPEVRQALHLGPLLIDGQAHDLTIPSPLAGETWSVAVRLLGHAAPGEVLVSPQFGRLVTGWCVLQARPGPAGGGQADQIGAYSVEGLVSPRSPQAGLGARVLSPFVGRRRELTMLQELLGQVEEGRGQVVGIVGEPGMGKSRLLYEFRRRLMGQQVTLLEGRCLSYGSAIPYLPVLDLLRDHCGINEADSVEARVEKVHASLQEVGMAPAEWAPYLLSLLGVQVETERLAAMPPETLKARAFETLQQLSLHRSRQQPLILAVEDLQWIDQTSEAFLTALVEKMGGAPLLLLATYRPEYRLPWPGKSYVTQIALPPLTPQDSLCVVRAVLQSKQVPQHLARVILAKAEGNPFFLEEIGQTLVDQEGSEIQIPPTVQGVLAARIDRLAAETRALLQTLAVLGRECALSLITQVVDQPEVDLQRQLMHLQAAELLYEQPGVPAPKYVFKHALTQDVAYAALPQVRRREVHERAAQAIEGFFHDRLGEHYSALAYHYSRSGNTAKAVYYLQQAGHQAEQHSACAEAISHVTTALELLPSLTDTSERMQQELRLQTTLGRALIATRGYAAPEVEHAYARALELCRQVGETSHLFQVLWGLRTFYLMRAEFQKARALAEEMLTLAQHQHDAALLLEAHQVLGKVLFWLGELGSAQAHVEQVIAIYNSQQHRSPAFIHGVSDLEVRGLSFTAWTLGLCGYPDQAVQRSNDALAIAQELAHPFSVAYALTVAAWVHQFRREVSRIHALTEALLALCREQGFGLHLTNGTILQGWALAEQGQAEAGTAQMRQGLATRRTTGMETTQTYYLALLAEGYGKSGQPAEGLTVVAEALAAVNQSGMRFYEAELYRLKGELLLAQAGKWHEGQEAEACFRQALAVARRQQAKWLELRATISLSRLWQQQGKRDAASHLLAEVYGWFTEGFETPDFRAAKALLTELAC
jgi:DNA-binding NtrC family response regulator/predicted ATPase/class 3 adenylate cyclase